MYKRYGSMMTLALGDSNNIDGKKDISYKTIRSFMTKGKRRLVKWGDKVLVMYESKCGQELVIDSYSLPDDESY